MVMAGSLAKVEEEDDLGLGVRPELRKEAGLHFGFGVSGVGIWA
jgi:hypothetical protein